MTPKTMKDRILAAVVMGICASAALAWVLWPQSYEQCIKDAAARANGSDKAFFFLVHKLCDELVTPQKVMSDADVFVTPTEPLKGLPGITK